VTATPPHEVATTEDVLMIEKHYGALLDGAHAGLVGRLDAIEAELEHAHAK
jgi:hypothetical protein